MGTLTVTFATTSPPQTVYNHAFTIPDSDLQRIVAAHQQAANTAINGTATSTQVATYIVQQIWIAGLSNAVVAHGDQQAIAALPPTPPVSAT